MSGVIFGPSAIAQLEDDIVERLGEALPVDELRLMAWPDQPLDTGKPLGRAAVMVRFSRLRLDPISRRTTGPTVQTGELDIEIRYLVKGLRSHTGAYPLIALTTDTLAGYMPQPSTLIDGMAAQLPGFYALVAQLVDHDKSVGVWDWGQMFRLNIDYRGRKGNGRRR